MFVLLLSSCSVASSVLTASNFAAIVATIITTSTHPHRRVFLTHCNSSLPLTQLVAKLSRETGTEAVLKIRTSPGLRTGKYLGNFAEKADSEADMAVVDSEKAVLVNLVSAAALLLRLLRCYQH